MDPNPDQLPLAGELKRKAIHLAMVFIPLVYVFYLDREQIVVLMVLLTILFFLAEWLRFRWSRGRKLFGRIFFPLLREGEKDRHLTGATLFLSGATLTVILFDKSIAVTSVMILAVSDSLAAVVGRLTGRHRFLAKSVEGSLTFFLCSILWMCIFITGMQIVQMILVAGMVTVVEASAVPLDDNLTVPLSAGLLLTLLA